MSGPWEKYQSKPAGKPWERYQRATPAAPQAPTTPVPPIPEVPLPEVPSGLERAARTADDVVRSLAQGATFGFADELAAAANAGMAALGGEDFGKQYEMALAAERARDREMNPAISIPSEIVGGMASTIAAAPALPIRAAASGLGRAAQVAGGGAALGGLSGFGHGEGESRLPQAAIGAGVGAAAPLALRGIAAPFAGATRRAAPRRLEATLRQSGMSPQEAQQGLASLGPQGMLADVSDATRQQLQSALSRAPAQVGRVSEVLEGRVAEAPSRLTQYVSRLAGGRNFRSTVDDMTAAQKAAAEPLYRQAAANTPVFRSPEVTQAIKAPMVRSSLNEAKKALGIKGDITDNDLSHALVDRTYKYLGDRASKQARAGKAFKSRDINNARVALKDAIVRESPEYGQALEAFSGPAQLKNLADAGSKFWNQSADDVQAAISKLTNQSDRDAYLLGVTKAIQDQISKGTYGSDLSRRLAGTPAKRDALRAVFPTRKGFDDFMRNLLSEGEFARTRNVALGGSQTQPRLSAAEEMGSMATESVLSGSPLPWMTRAGRRLFSGEMSPKQARDLTGLLTTRGLDVESALARGRPSGAPLIGAGAGLGGLSQELRGLR